MGHNKTLIQKIKESKQLLIIFLPVFIYYLVFCYLPMYGILEAFTDYMPGKGVFGSPWVGLKWFKKFFSGLYFARTFKNTLLLGLYSVLWTFPVPIVFALFLNEIKDGFIKRFVQTVSYLPRFLSTVVVVGMFMGMLSPSTGVVNNIIKSLGAEPVNFFNESSWFRTLYIGTDIWQGFGWGSIIYIAAISSIEISIYESADIDGASRFQKMVHITLPCIVPTITILLILSLGNIMGVGFEKINLMYNPSIFDVSDVISTYTYRMGIMRSEYSYGTAVGLFNSFANMILLLFFNGVSRKVAKISLF